MNILYIAYSCDPYNGSEDQIGWNIPFYMTKNKENNIYVITKMEHQQNINKYLENNSIDNLHFIFVDINNNYKKILKGFFYSIRLKIWNKKALKVAQNIVESNNIKLIHQITPIEFRAIGGYYKIKNIKYMVGPIGGGSSINKGLKKYVPKKYFLVECIRSCANLLFSLKFKFLKLNKKIDCIIYSNYETMNYLSDKEDNLLRIELGINDDIKVCDEPQNDKKNITTFLFPGRLVFIKGHRVLFDIIKNIPEDYNYIVNVVGDGPDMKYLKKHIKSDEIFKSKINLVGRVDFKKMSEYYNTSDVVLIPSLRENCATTMLEAFSYGKPVIATNMCGMKLLLEDKCGFLIDADNNACYINEFSNAMIYFMKNKNTNEYKYSSNKCKEVSKKYLWKKNIEFYKNIYDKILSENGEKND